METTEQVTPRIHKPPPIYVKNISRFSHLCGALVALVGKEAFTCKARITDLIINPATPDSYREIIRYLTAEQAEFHTYQLQEEKAYRVVIRHLHQTTPVEMITEELTELGHSVRKVSPVLHPATKQPLPLFFIDLDPAPNNKDIFNLEALCYTRIKVEEPHKQRGIVQCKRCQEYGHTKSYCKYRPRCVKCAGDHFTQECDKQRSDPAKCALCHGDHPANYKGCAVHRELQRARRTTPVYEHPSAVRRSSAAQPTSGPQLKPSAFSTSETSYAQVVSGSPGNQPSHPTTVSHSSDVAIALNSFLSDFKSLINPLITLLTTVVNTLLPRLTP
ncbi:hypothetical protein O3M35_010233 [Rhynocoris fuscipes]|uniref:Pre-C2HC domain-containing protein n=1 Tax=Rhynocoris fuscipes TaxID=488301 RepID=A0AAW1CYG8_9HEMI